MLTSLLQIIIQRGCGAPEPNSASMAITARLVRPNQADGAWGAVAESLHLRRVRASPIIVADNELGALNAFDGSKGRDEHGSVGDVPLLHGDDDHLWR